MPNSQMLTLAAMQSHIKDGRSVMWAGRIITRIEDLPSELELAGEDKEARRLARAKLREEISRLAALAGDDDEGEPAPPEGGMNAPNPASRPKAR